MLLVTIHISEKYVCGCEWRTNKGNNKIIAIKTTTISQHLPWGQAPVLSLLMALHNASALFCLTLTTTMRNKMSPEILAFPLLTIDFFRWIKRAICNVSIHFIKGHRTTTLDYIFNQLLFFINFIKKLHNGLASTIILLTSIPSWVHICSIFTAQELICKSVHCLLIKCSKVARFLRLNIMVTGL